MTTPVSEKIYPPWDERTVSRLNAFQSHGGLHPFTCPRTGSTLIATTDGWTCSTCSYNQTWAHAFMADPTTWPTFTAGLLTVQGDRVTITRGRQHGHDVEEADRWWYHRHEDLSQRVYRAFVVDDQARKLHDTDPVFSLHVKLVVNLIRELDNALSDDGVSVLVRDHAVDRALFGHPDLDPRHLADAIVKLISVDLPPDLGVTSGGQS